MTALLLLQKEKVSKKFFISDDFTILWHQMRTLALTPHTAILIVLNFNPFLITN